MASLTALKQRAYLYQQIRDFFSQRQVLEVETPLLGDYGVTDVHVENIVVGNQLLQTSPEYAMKVLLARDHQSIFQICKAFRANEYGLKHRQEFSLLEWYRVDYNHHELMDEMDALLQLTLGCQPAERCSYRSLFMRHLDIDPLECSLADCLGLLAQPIRLTNKDDALTLLMGERIEPQLGRERPIFIHDYPASQAALAKLSADNPGVAERFEVYYRGIELANGFHELTDAQEQRQRFVRDQAERAARGLVFREIDPQLMWALEGGLPDCAGVALGLDRLLMLRMNVEDIKQVIIAPTGQSTSN